MYLLESILRDSDSKLDKIIYLVMIANYLLTENCWLGNIGNIRIPTLYTFMIYFLMQCFQQNIK